jgi:hypothetical protein
MIRSDPILQVDVAEKPAANLVVPRIATPDP